LCSSDLQADDNPKLANERKRENNLIERNKQQDFINEFMIMLIEKATEYINIDVSKIKIPSSVLDETKDYIEENNPIIHWLHNNVQITNNPKDRIKTSDMHRNYNEDENNEKRLSSVEFSKYMKFNGFEYKTIRGQRYYKGCVFVQPDQDKEMRDVKNQLDFV